MHVEFMPPVTGRHENEHGTKNADLLGVDLIWWYPVDRPRGRHEWQTPSLALYIEAQEIVKTWRTDRVMAEFMGLTTKQIVARDNDLDSDPVV